MSTAQTLLPCPFCGGPANFLDACEPRKPLYWAECKACGVPGADDVTVEGAAAKWNRRAALTQGAGAVEPVAYRMRYRSEPGMIGHYPWSYLELAQRSKTPHPAHEYEDLYAAPPAQQLQQAVARAVEECAVICEGMHEEDRPGDYAAAIRAKGTHQ